MEGDVEGGWSDTVAVNGLPLDSSSVVFEPADKGTDPLSTGSSLTASAFTFSASSLAGWATEDSGRLDFRLSSEKDFDMKSWLGCRLWVLTLPKKYWHD